MGKSRHGEKNGWVRGDNGGVLFVCVCVCVCVCVEICVFKIPYPNSTCGYSSPNVEIGHI